MPEADIPVNITYTPVSTQQGRVRDARQRNSDMAFERKIRMLQTRLDLANTQLSLLKDWKGLVIEIHGDMCDPGGDSEPNWEGGCPCKVAAMVVTSILE